MTNENSFAGGARAMCRSCQAALELVRRGKWDLEMFERWLGGVLNSDPESIMDILKHVEGENERTKND